MKIVKKYGWKKFFLFILSPIIFVIVLGVKIWSSLMDKKTKAAVVKAQTRQQVESQQDAQAITEVVARQEGKVEAVEQRLETIQQTTEPGSNERLDAITDEVAEMSKRRHEEALRRARRP